MIPFREPSLDDRDAAFRAVAASGCVGSDAAFANLFLLRRKYGTLVALRDGFLFRLYRGTGSRRGYAFPLGPGDPGPALDAIRADAEENGRPLEFCLVDGERAALLAAKFGDAVRFEPNRGDADYLYRASDLAELPGRAYMKKRNRVARFARNCPGAEFAPLGPETAGDARAVERRWLGEAEPEGAADEAAAAERSEDAASRLAEAGAIEEALERFDALGLRGALLRVAGEPVAMTMASEIAPGVWDAHFEKAVGEAAANGAYAAINKFFAASLPGAVLVNREEDLGMEGLRRAKLSYGPSTILEKSRAVVDLDALRRREDR